YLFPPESLPSSSHSRSWWNASAVSSQLFLDSDLGAASLTFQQGKIGWGMTDDTRGVKNSDRREASLLRLDGKRGRTTGVRLRNSGTGHSNFSAPREWCFFYAPSYQQTCTGAKVLCYSGFKRSYRSLFFSYLLA